MSFPLLTIGNVATNALGFPSLFTYVFGFWFVIILLFFWFSRRGKKVRQ